MSLFWGDCHPLPGMQAEVVLPLLDIKETEPLGPTPGKALPFDLSRSVGNANGAGILPLYPRHLILDGKYYQLFDCDPRLGFALR
jgi:hypothetical protein